MKKLLSILAAMGLSATASVGVVACGTSNKSGNEVVSPDQDPDNVQKYVPSEKDLPKVDEDNNQSEQEKAANKELEALQPKNATASYKVTSEVSANQWDEVINKSNTTKQSLMKLVEESKSDKELDDALWPYLPSYIKDNKYIDKHAKVVIATFFARVKGSFLGTAWVDNYDGKTNDENSGYSIKDLQNLYEKCGFSVECKSTLSNVLEVANKMKEQTAETFKGNEAVNYVSYLTRANKFDELVKENDVNKLEEARTKSMNGFNGQIRADYEKVVTGEMTLKDWISKYDVEKRNDAYENIQIWNATTIIEFVFHQNETKVTYDDVVAASEFDTPDVDFEMTRENVLWRFSVNELMSNLMNSGRLDQAIKNSNN